jgi:class 3 adenylate cyclase
MTGSPQPTTGVSLPFGATVTILFSDIRGFTEYTDHYGDEAAYRVIRQHDTVIRSQIETFGGRVVKTQGDSFMVYFTTARAAILCAIAVQRAIADTSRDEPDARIGLGIGINTGEPIQQGGDFFGSTVNLAARICASAGPGQILISETTRHVAGRIEAVEYVDRGLRELKGFQEPQRLFEVSAAAAETRGAPRGLGTRDLRTELAALAERFAGLGAELVSASRAMGAAGAPPSDDLASRTAELRAAFADLRERVLQRASALGVAVGAERETLVALGDLEQVLQSIDEAEGARPEGASAVPEDRPSREAMEAALQRAIPVLNRVLVITHRDDPAFQPLIECQAKASDLRLRLSRAVSQDSAPVRADESIAPFADLLLLVVGRDNLDDERYAKAEDTVTRTFGRPLAVAATRGRLSIEGVARPAAAPSAPAAPVREAAPAPDQRSPRPPADERRAPAAPSPAEAGAALPPADPRDAAVPWWAAASAAWRSWKGSGMATAHALRAALAKHPHLLGVPIRESARYDEGQLASGYFLLLEHVENISPSFVRNAMERATEAAGGAAGGAVLDDALYQLLVTRGRLHETYPDFVRDVMIAAIPNPGVWLDGSVTENADSTVVVRHADPAIGSKAEREEVLTEQKDRVAEHRFVVALAPFTARFFALKRGDVKEARDVEVKVSSGGEASEDAWVLTLRSDHMLHAPPKRYAASAGVMPGFGKNYSGVWIGVFNAGDRPRESEVAVSVRPELRVVATRPSVFGGQPR